MDNFFPFSAAPKSQLLFSCFVIQNNWIESSILKSKSWISFGKKEQVVMIWLFPEKKWWCNKITSKSCLWMLRANLKGVGLVKLSIRLHSFQFRRSNFYVTILRKYKSIVTPFPSIGIIHSLASKLDFSLINLIINTR